LRFLLGDLVRVWMRMCVTVAVRECVRVRKRVSDLNSCSACVLVGVSVAAAVKERMLAAVALGRGVRVPLLVTVPVELDVVAPVWLPVLVELDVAVLVPLDEPIDELARGAGCGRARLATRATAQQRDAAATIH
jgi:hypothetical protein